METSFKKKNNQLEVSYEETTVKKQILDRQYVERRLGSLRERLENQSRISAEIARLEAALSEMDKLGL